MREFWEECGAVAEVDLMRFPDTGRFKGIAFITFATVSPSPASSPHLRPRLQTRWRRPVQDTGMCDCVRFSVLVNSAPGVVTVSAGSHRLLD